MDASAEEYIDKAWLVNESIKAIATEMSPGASSKQLQAGISSQRDTLLGYNNIQRNGELFPDSIRQSPTENESSHARWHEMNFPNATVSNIKQKIGRFQTFINLSPQVPLQRQ